MPQHNPKFEGKKVDPPKKAGRSAPTVEALASAAYEAADNLIGHLATCFANECDTAKHLGKIYRIKKAAALKALRKSKPLRGSSAKGGRG